MRLPPREQQEVVISVLILLPDQSTNSPAVYVRRLKFVNGHLMRLARKNTSVVILAAEVLSSIRANFLLSEFRSSPVELVFQPGDDAGMHLADA